MKTDYYSRVHESIQSLTHTHTAEIKPRHTHTHTHKALGLVCGGVSVSVAVAAEWRMGDDFYADGVGRAACTSTCLGGDRTSLRPPPPTTQHI